MTPEDVLIESIQAAWRYGDTPELRKQQCEKLKESIRASGFYAAVPFVKDTYA